MQLLLVGVLLVVVGLWWYARSKDAKLRRIVDVETGARMPAIPFFIALYYFLIGRRSKGLCEQTKFLHSKYGPEHCVNVILPTVTISKIEDARTVLKKLEEVPKRENPKNIQKIVGPLFGTQSIISVNNPTWHSHRSLMNRSFTDNKIFFQPLLNKVTQCIDMWKPAGPVKVGPYLQKMTLDALGNCIFGKEFDTLNGDLQGPLNAYNTMIESLFSPIFFLFPWVFDLPLPHLIKLRASCKEFDEYCWSVIKQSKEEKASDPGYGQNLISAMIVNGLPDDVVRDNIGLFFLAGHETTASTLGWALGLLASNKEAQQQIRAELQKITDNFSRPLEYEDLKELHYIDWVIHETMRIHPVASVAGGRHTSKDIQIGQWFIPKNTTIQINLTNMLHDETLWPDPLRFDPLRWSPDRLTKDQRTSWMPFSYGPRVCIGMNFSLVEQKIFFYVLFKEFSEIRFAPGGSVAADKKAFLHSPDQEKLVFEFVR